MDISMKKLCSQGDHAWSWNKTFLEIVDGWMQDSRPQKAAPQQRVRLGCWLEQVVAARELYRQGHREALWMLYDYWQTIAEDVPEQARLASEMFDSRIADAILRDYRVNIIDHFGVRHPHRFRVTIH